ncbi:MAG: PAS-domain containing protein, partial [Pseudomonadota bacterium]
MTLVSPSDTPERREEKLLLICQSLMNRVEQASTNDVSAFEQFQRSVVLEERVKDRTKDLERALQLLNDSNAQLAAANTAAMDARAHLHNAIEALPEGFALFGADDALIMFNERFCAAMPDVRDQLVDGLPFRAYVEAVSASDYLDLGPAGRSGEWTERRMAMHARGHAMFNLRLADGSFFQVSEQRTPDGGA